MWDPAGLPVLRDATRVGRAPKGASCRIPVFQLLLHSPCCGDWPRAVGVAGAASLQPCPLAAASHPGPHATYGRASGTQLASARMGNCSWGTVAGGACLCVTF